MHKTVLVVGAVLLAGCAAGAPSSTPMPSPTPTPSPTPAAFTLDVLPPEVPPEVRTAIPGEGVAFLVVITDQAAAAAPVTITATATGAAVRSIEPASLVAGKVGEVWVVPDPSSVEAIAHVKITGSRDGVVKTVERSLPVFPMADERRSDAQPYFAKWADWLVTAHPELGITADTAWTPEFVSTLLVVSHYAYWSPDWEVTVLWHNMIAPYDWTEIHLRHRWTESAPSLAFRIDSVSGNTAPHAVDPPEVVVR